MSIADTIKSMKDHTKEAYDTAEAKGAALPEEKNLANLSDTIAQLDKIDIVQETGDSETAVMSQKATTDAIDGIEVPKLPATMVYDFVSPAGANNPSTADNANITARVVNTTTGNVTNATLMMPMASDTQAGSVTAADKSKLDSLLEIKSLNDSLELDENGQLSVVGGGGSDVNLLDVYTSAVTSNDVYNAVYTNNRLNSTTVHLGDKSQALGNNSVAIGASTSANFNNAVAIGNESKVTRNYEFSVGAPATPRYVSNVQIGVKATDAVNLKQMQDYVAEHSGSDYQLPAYVVGNTTELDPVAYTVTEDTVTANVARTDTATGTALNPALVTFPMATATHAGAMSSADKTTLENLPNNYYTKAEIDNMIGDINEAIVKLDTGTGV